MAEIQVADHATDSIVEDCISIARGLEEYFTDDAIGTMRADLPKQQLFLANQESRPVGFLSIADAGEPTAELAWIGVRQDCQRQGIGSALLDAASDHLREHGSQLLLVKTLAETVEYEPYAQTRQFYRAHDFVHVETIEPYPGWDPGNPCALYLKILDDS